MKRSTQLLLCLVLLIVLLLIEIVRVRSSSQSGLQWMLTVVVAGVVVGWGLWESRRRQRVGTSRAVAKTGAEWGCWAHLDSGLVNQPGAFVASRDWLQWLPSDRAKKAGCPDFAVDAQDIVTLKLTTGKFGVRRLPMIVITTRTGGSFSALLLDQNASWMRNKLQELGYSTASSDS